MCASELMIPGHVCECMIVGLGGGKQVGSVVLFKKKAPPASRRASLSLFDIIAIVAEIQDFDRQFCCETSSQEAELRLLPGSCLHFNQLLSLFCTNLLPKMGLSVTLR